MNKFVFLIMAVLTSVCCLNARGHRSSDCYKIPDKPVAIPIVELSNESLELYLNRQLIPLLMQEKKSVKEEHRIYIDFVDKTPPGEEYIKITCIAGEVVPVRLSDLTKSPEDYIKNLGVLRTPDVSIFVSDNIDSKWLNKTGFKTKPLQWCPSVTDLVSFNDAQIDIYIILSESGIVVEHIEKWEIFTDKKPWAYIPLKYMERSRPSERITLDEREECKKQKARYSPRDTLRLLEIPELDQLQKKR